MERGFMTNEICSEANSPIWANPRLAVRLMLAVDKSMVISEAVKTVRNFPVEMSRRETGVTSMVSKVPRSFSPAVKSMAGYVAPTIAKITIM